MPTTTLFRSVIGCAVAALLVALLLASPASAGERFSSTGPDLSAVIAGSNEHPAGQTVPLIVVVQNSGLIEGKDLGLVGSTEPLPNTAKSVTVALSGADGIVVQSDPQMVGDILGGASAQATFRIQIPADTPAGTYTLPLKVTYSYISSSDRIGTTAVSYQYEDVTETIPLTMTVPSEIVLRVDNVSTEALNVGTEGYLNLTVTNVGAEPGTNTIVVLTPNLASPISPVDGSAFIGAFAPGQTVNLRYKVAVSSEAAAQSYPVHLVVSYEDRKGIDHTNPPVAVGVPIGGKIDFAVVSTPASIAAGERRVLEVVFQNTGAAIVKDAQAKLSAVDPFTATDDSAFLGDMAPGENRTARFEVTADGDAIAKGYALNSEIRYSDTLDNALTSDSMKVPVTVTAGESALGSPLVLAVIALVIIGGAYMLYRRRKGTA